VSFPTLIPIIVTGSWPTPGANTPSGAVTFTLTAPLTGSGEIVPVIPIIATLDATGEIAQQLYATDVDELTPPNAQYQVDEQVGGGTTRTYFITVPHEPPGSRSVDDGVLSAGSAVLSSMTATFSATDVGRYVYVVGLPAGITIRSVTNANEVTLSTTAPRTAEGVSVLIGAQADLAELAP
jgi:hypothetical protein